MRVMEMENMSGVFLVRTWLDRGEWKQVDGGLEEIRNGNYDLVLLDLSMPEFSGLDVIDALEKEDLIKKQKIVLFTASPPSDEEIKSLLARGLHSIIKKPLDVDVLLEHIEKIDSELN